METNRVKHYETNRFVCVSFYLAILWPPLIIYITYISSSPIEELWPLLVFIYIFAFPMEYFAIKLWKVNITIDEKGIEIRRSKQIQKAEWANIAELKEYIYGAGEFFYNLKTKDKKIIGFTSSIRNRDDLLKEIENRTGLKFKTRI